MLCTGPCVRNHVVARNALVEVRAWVQLAQRRDDTALRSIHDHPCGGAANLRHVLTAKRARRDGVGSVGHDMYGDQVVILHQLQLAKGSALGADGPTCEHHPATANQRPASGL